MHTLQVAENHHIQLNLVVQLPLSCSLSFIIVSSFSKEYVGNNIAAGIPSGTLHCKDTGLKFGTN